MKIFEADDKRTFSQIAETQPICRRATSISFASASLGSIFVVAEENGRCFVYDRIRPTEFSLAVTINQHKGPINCVEFAPGELTFACGSSDGFISNVTCDMKNWSWQMTRCSDKPVSSVSWAPPSSMAFIENPTADSKSRHLVAGAADGRFTVFTVRNSAFIPEGQPVQAHDGAVNSVAWRPLPGFSRWEIATCGSDNLVKLWTLESGGTWKCTVICECQEEPVAVKWSNCGFLMSISEGLSTVRTLRESSAGVWTFIHEQ